MKKEQRKMIGFRIDSKTAKLLQRIAEEENRSMSNVVVNIVNEYLSSTNGRLLKDIKIVPNGRSA